MSTIVFRKDLVKCHHTYNLGFGDEKNNPYNINHVPLERYQVPYIKFDGYWYKLKKGVSLTDIASKIKNEVYSSEQFENLIIENLEQIIKKTNNKVLIVEYEIFDSLACGYFIKPNDDEDSIRALREVFTKKGTGEVVRVFKDKYDRDYFLIVDDVTGRFVKARISDCRKL